MRFSITVALAAALAGSAFGNPGVSPASVNQDARPGEHFDITKTVVTPEIPPKPDIVLLVDNTGSMGPAIANVKANLITIISTVQAEQQDAEFAVAQFGDLDLSASTVPFEVVQGLTNNPVALQTAINSLTAEGGGDTPEDWINALFQLATGAVTFRPGSSRIIVLITDNPSHNPSGGHSLADTITVLTAAPSIRVIAVNVITPPPSVGINGAVDGVGPDQGTAVTTATGGSVVPADPASVSAAILNGLKNLDVTVKPEIFSCDPSLTVSFAPTTTTVQSGSTVTFVETIAVASNAPQGSTLQCSVRFLLNNLPGGNAFDQSITIKVQDITPPTVGCVEGRNPAGKTNPDKNANFWTLNSSDNLDSTVSIRVRDSASGTDFGSFPAGTNIKLVQAPGAPPDKKRGEGAVDWQITVNGCAVLVATDAAGNSATANCCARMPPPNRRRMQW